MKRKSKKLLLILLITILSAILLFGGVVTYAYFSTVGYVVTEDGDKQIAKIGMNISLLFDRLDPAKVDGTVTILTEADKTEVKFDQTAEWGTKENPYIISDIRHLQNLSVLQGIGYFDELYIKKNYNNGTYNEGSKEMPYFLVCDPDGTPATIDGTDITFAPIGSDEYPFIGYVGGAFAEGTTDVGGKTSPVSTLTNIQVVTTEDQPDVGLFGYIGYLGDENTATGGTETTPDTFKGQVTTVRDLVLSDVTVSVRVETWAEALTKALHRFSFDKVSDADLEKVPQENHHIGILAGHVEYAQVEYISVYYSNDEQIAIDLQHTTESTSGDIANYMSASGIIGFMHNMNPKITENGIGVGTGTNASDISVSAGVGTGGGLASGTGRGYVTAENLYGNFENGGTNDRKNRENGQVVYEYYLTEEAAASYGILIECDDISANPKVYHTRDDNNDSINDSKTVTVADGKVTLDGNTWTDYIVYDKASGKYYDKMEKQEIFRFQAIDLVIQNGISVTDPSKALCTEYIRNGILWGTQATDCYYFYDGVFTFALSDPTDVITDTWKNDTPDTLFVGDDNPANWKANTTKGNNSVVAYVKDIPTEAALQAAISAGQQIYIGYENADGTVSLMSLTESGAGSGNFWDRFADNYFKTIAFKQPWIDDESEIISIQETLRYALENGEQQEGMLPFGSDDKSNEYLIENIDEYKIINLGSGDNLTTIKNQYPITVSRGTNDPTLYHLKNNENFLAMVRQRMWIFVYSNTYSIWAGPKKPENQGTRTYYWQNEASIAFIENGNVQISFTYNEDGENQTRYVQYDSANNQFGGIASNTDSNTKLKLYTVEGTSNLNFGRITYEPKDTSTTNKSFPCDQYVLRPQTSSTPVDAVTSDDPVYDLVNVSELGDGWNNEYGQKLTKDDLHKKFKLTKEIQWGLTLNIFNGSWNFGSSGSNNGSMVAPIGTNGVEANIPLGCIAFRINKTGESKIRVIVACPVDEHYITEDGYKLKETEDYYFGVWRTEAAGESLLQGFNKDNSLYKFELPRSRPYDPSSTAAESDYVQVNYGGKTCRSYLNGSQVLIAYEFTVNEEGVYVLGATNGPMEIVYFSADGTASAGRDGTGGSKLGSIDFVYDYDGKIVPVQDYTPTPDDYKPETYKYYYPTLCLMYTNNFGTGTPFPNINDLQVKIRRTAGSSGTDLYVNGTGQIKLWPCVGYAADSDKVHLPA